MSRFRKKYTIKENINKISDGNPLASFIEWNSDEYGEMDCFKGFIKDYHSLAKIDEIKKDFDEDASNEYIEFEVSFDKDKKLREVHMLLQEYPDNEWTGDTVEWTDPELIGSEILDDARNIIGHTLLSEEEYKYLVDMATKELEALVNARQREEVKDWIIGISGSNMDDVVVYTYKGTKDQVKEVLLRIALRNAQEETKNDPHYFDFGTTDIDEVRELPNGRFYAFNCFTDCHEDYTATPVESVDDIASYL